MDKNILNLVVKNKEGVVLEGEYKAVSCFNEKGIFDVLPLHENFISIIKNKIIIHERNGSLNEVNIDKGVLKVTDNKVDIYLGL